MTLERQIVALLLSLAAVPAVAAELHVAPAGSDANPGTADKPFATLGQARDAVRELPRTEPIRVIVAGGTYAITEPLTFGPPDSGTVAATVSYEAKPGERPVVSGGRTLGGWKPAGDGLWTTQVPEVADGKWRFEQLWVNGRRATRARTPNEFGFYATSVAETPAADGKTATQTVTLRSEDFAALAGTPPEAVRDVNLFVYHKWDVTQRFLDRLDEAAHAVVTSGVPMKPYSRWEKDARFVLENFRAALDAPGEWFIARDGELTYKPRPGEDMTTAEVVAPVAEKLLVLTGDPSAGKFVEHVAFKGLTFRHGQRLTPPEGFGPVQAAATIEAAVQVDGARNILIEDCEIAHVGLYGVWFRKGCRDCTLRHCLVEDLGAGGVRIGETRIAPDGPERTSRIAIDNNIVRRGGRMFAPAVGMWIGQSGDNAVTHNEIADFYYTGVSAGWTWGYSEGLAKRNMIAFNRVHHIGQGVLSDMGGIYTLGPSEGTVVRNNVFHDVYAYSYGGWGLYPDEGSTGVTFENNLVYNTKTGSFHQHYGKENVIRNNILAFSELHQLQATRVENHRSFTFERNVVCWDRGELLSGPWDKLNYVSRNNLYWQADGKPVKFLGHPLAEWQAAGHEQGSQVADPKFAAAKERDFRLAPDSPAFALGFEAFDPSAAGVSGDDAWKRKAADAKYPPLKVAPPPQ